MFKSLGGNHRYNYRTIRGFQITTVFTFTIFLQEAIRYPHAGWTGFGVMMIYAGFDSGATISRAYQRFLGMLLGLESGYFLWVIGHLDYRTLIVLIPMTVFFAYYLVGEKYSAPTAFAVNTSIIGVGYFAYDSRFTITNFLIDYFICTLIAFVIIYLFETLWFSRYKMMMRFLDDKKMEVINLLYTLDDLLKNKKLKRKVWFDGCMLLISKLDEVNKMTKNVHFEKKSQAVVGNDFNDFVELANRIYVSQKALYFAHFTKRYEGDEYHTLLRKVKNDLARLKADVTEKSHLHDVKGEQNAQTL